MYNKHKGTLLMTVAKVGNNNTFLIAFTLVEDETDGGWSFFLKNFITHIAN